MPAQPTMEPQAARELIAAHGSAPTRLTVRSAVALLRAYLSGSGLAADRWGNYPLGADRRWHFSAQNLQLQEKYQGSWMNVESKPVLDAALAVLAEAATSAGDEACARRVRDAVAARGSASSRRSEKAAAESRVSAARAAAFRRLAEMHPRDALRGLGWGPRLDAARAEALQAELAALADQARAGGIRGDAPPVSAARPPTLPLARRESYEWVEQVGGSRYTVSVLHSEPGRASVEIGASGVSVDAATGEWRPASARGRVGDAYVAGSVSVSRSGEMSASLLLIVSRRPMAGAQAMSVWCALMRGYGVKRWVGQGVNEQGERLLRGLERIGHLRVVSLSGSTAVVECSPERRANPPAKGRGAPGLSARSTASKAGGISVSLMDDVAGEDAAHLSASPAGASFLTPFGASVVSELSARAGVVPPETVYEVNDSWVREDLRGSGVGAWMYAEAARLAWLAARAPLVASRLFGGGTSRSAMRVWSGASLASVAATHADGAAIWDDSHDPDDAASASGLLRVAARFPGGRRRRRRRSAAGARVSIDVDRGGDGAVSSVSFDLSVEGVERSPGDGAELRLGRADDMADDMRSRRGRRSELADELLKRHRADAVVAELWRLKVPPQAQGRGVGAELLRRALAEAGAARAESVYAVVEADGDSPRAAIDRVLERAGFSLSGVRDRGRPVWRADLTRAS